jgi:predicted O-methyltransferase YrrM
MPEETLTGSDSARRSAAPEGRLAGDLKDQAARLLDSGELNAAFNLLIEAKALKQPAQGLDQLRALCFLRMGQPLGAVEALREELRLFPDNAAAAAMLAMLQKEMPEGAYGSCGAGTPEFRELLQIIRPYTMLSEGRLFSLYSHAKSVCEQGLPGNFVECGVAAGGSSALLAWVLKKYSRHPRRLFSFDSFSGMPRPSAFDSHQGIGAESTGWGTGTCAAPQASLREVCDKLDVTDAVTPVQGYFEDTLPLKRDAVGMIALLHLDGDWYQSTLSILENLYDRLMPGALLQVDDYGYWDGCRQAIHEFEAARGLSFAINPIDGTGVWFSKPDRFPINPALPLNLVEDFQVDDPAAKGVASQMSANERFQLYYALRQELPVRSRLTRFVEIGSYGGASLLLTHQALQRRGGTFQGICIEPEGTQQFHEIVKYLATDVVHLPMFSHEAAQRLSIMCEPARLPEFIFVDGDHSYQGVRQDILDFFPLLAPGGLMVFHDYLPALDDTNREAILQQHGNVEPGIRQACQELMEDSYGCQVIELPLLHPSDPSQSQAQLPIVPGVFSSVRAYRKPEASPAASRP